MNEQLDIHGTPFPVVWHQLKLTPDLSFELCISRDETDEISSAIREGSYAFPLPYSLLTAFAPPGGRVLDLGAHVGTFSLYAATQGHEVLAVEASPVNAALLAASIARNPGARIRLEHIAVSNQPGTVEFLAAGPYGLIANAVLRGPTVTISAATVDAILDNAHWDTVDFVKLDIEGSEPNALAGMERLLSRPDAPPILFESNLWTLGVFGKTPADIFAPLETHGYRCYVIRGRTLAPVRSTDLQPETMWDCLAFKQLSATVTGWEFVPPLETAQVIEHALASCASSSHFDRLCIGRALASHQELIASDPRLSEALDRLRADIHPWVREAVQWWQSPAALNSQIASLRALLAENEAERQRLTDRIAAYERGRFMRLMRWLHRLLHPAKVG